MAREEGGRWTSILGDAVACMQVMPAATLDAVITDPPYGSGGFSVKDRQRSSKSKYVTTGAKYKNNCPDIDGDNLHPLAWSETLRRFARQSIRVLREGGHFLCFIDWRNLPELSGIVHGAGLRMRNVVVWDKGRASRVYRGGFRLQAEYVLWATKGKLKVTERPVYLDGVLKYSTLSNGKIHITQKPLGLMQELVRVCPQRGRVLDPFQGSGTTGVAALLAGLRYTGIESVEAYHQLAIDRLAKAEQEAKKSAA